MSELTQGCVKEDSSGHSRYLETCRWKRLGIFSFCDDTHAFPCDGVRSLGELRGKSLSELGAEDTGEQLWVGFPLCKHYHRISGAK